MLQKKRNLSANEARETMTKNSRNNTEKSYSTTDRASDRVRQKMGNSAAFSREIMRQERSIMRQIMRFFKS